MYFLMSLCLTNYNRVLIAIFIPENIVFKSITLQLPQENIVAKFVVFDLWSE